MRSHEPRIHAGTADAGEESALRDFPLHPGVSEPPFPAPVSGPVAGTATADSTAEAGAAAPLSPRWSAAAADAALVLLLTAIAILAARWVTGRTPVPAGMVWAGAFLVFLSFFAVVPALVLFGKTIGMALAELSVRSEAGAAGIDAGDAARRWLGTLATGVAAGLPLIWTARDAHAPTPADRLSGRALSVD